MMIYLKGFDVVNRKEYLRKYYCGSILFRGLIVSGVSFRGCP